MTDKDLIKQLSTLKQAEPAKDWLAANRAVLQSQLYGNSEFNLSLLNKFNIFMSRLAQPSFVAAAIFVFLILSGMTGWYSGNAQPGDSLYVAKRLSEQAKMTAALTDNGKAKLNMAFAAERLKEINHVLAGETDQTARETTITQLKISFKKEINQAKQRVIGEEEIKFYGAGTEEKADNGLDIALPRSSQSAKAGLSLETDQPSETTTPVTSETQPKLEAEQPAEIISGEDTAKVLDEAEKLIDQNDYSGAAQKLAEAGKLMEAGE